ncbi:hypothetical protein AQUCO_02200093v1 [Aquilegia coerulea]|uniref:C2H2-type domain-containing protein n=1 Tax=Aquilegia coerulea TaxID=218851 RepID=A0A2G5DD40_AQUCA|nr:hypothetical protein AQUCO_02200093v1 [Aquilegia coerulea]
MKPSTFSAPLKKINPILINGIPQVPCEILEQGIKTWSDHLVGYFVEKSLSIQLVKNALQQLWKNTGTFDITSDGELFYLSFADVRDKQKILEKGPINIAGRSFIIRQWTEDVEDHRKKVASLPISIWVKFLDVPKQLWTDDGLSYLGSLIGTPLYQDEATAKKKQLNYAKICVEVQVDDKFPTSVTVGMGSGKNAIIGVEYQWVPSTCSSCNRFGHNNSKCTTKMSSEPTKEIGETSCVPNIQEVLNVGLGVTTGVSICSSNVELQEQILGEEVVNFSLEQVNDEIVVESVSSGVVILDKHSLPSAFSNPNAHNDEALNEWTIVGKTKGVAKEKNQIPELSSGEIDPTISMIKQAINLSSNRKIRNLDDCIKKVWDNSYKWAYGCRKCSKFFSNKENVRSHISTAHAEFVKKLSKSRGSRKKA